MILARLASVGADDYVRSAAAGRAGVAELADALDLGSSDANRGGSNPPARTSGAPPSGAERAKDMR